MEWDIIQWGQFYTILMIGIALGMDAFSLGIGMGMLRIRLRTIAKVSLLIGLFHVIMPLIGIGSGKFLSSVVGDVATFIGGLILCFLGANMIWGSIFQVEGERTNYKTEGFGLLLFALSVSVDALSVGLSFGLFKTDIILAVLIFGIIGMAMTCCGLLLGKHVGHRLGGFGEALGGVIIFAFGIKFML
ncbi:manganese efflux pump MntP family protein [Ammoniphilus sp. CFH 90114]|uniref:manganese efflux pump MntP n=1 Tax=Ammoniphilus sp. CFH 90114 TaxID=2493665 RepID=UPI00100F4017|nr:manganese efflux pump MntP family protein [Ammoniphilus sp. CFH 90114]RXT08688.1 manganese efflux pump [Ammoniphilus sp. CFH 90114]